MLVQTVILTVYNCVSLFVEIFLEMITFQVVVLVHTLFIYDLKKIIKVKEFYEKIPGVINFLNF